MNNLYPFIFTYLGGKPAKYHEDIFIWVYFIYLIKLSLTVRVWKKTI